MADTVTIDRAGRVVIPKRLRDDLGLQAGDSLSLASDGQQVTLRPVRAGTRMRKKHGIWVFHGGERMSVEDTNRALDEIREERERAIFDSKE